MQQQHQQLTAGEEDIVYPSALPFLLVHAACLGAIWTGVTLEAVGLAVALYFARMFGVCAGYHRYFSHRSYATSRAFQFFLACLAQSTSQKSVLWWAAKHRWHHAHSDTPLDVHSPRQKGFWYAHVGWIFTRRHDEADLAAVADLTRYPELRLLHRFEQAPTIALAVLCYLIAGWPGLVVGFFWSTVALYHGTFCINSLAHVHGTKRYLTGDDSRNNWFLAIITLGEGWHNNHHAFQSAARQGFYWWEFDPTYYLLVGLAKVRIVSNLKQPPKAVLANRYYLGGRVIERAANDLVATFDLAAIAENLRAHIPDVQVLRARLAEAQKQAGEALTLPQDFPTLDDMRRKARAMFVDAVSMDDICARAHAKLVAALGARFECMA